MKLYVVLICLSTTDIFCTSEVTRRISPELLQLDGPRAAKSPGHQCPAECDCDSVPGQAAGPVASVFCFRGNLTQNVFSRIIKDLPQNVTSITVEAPLTRPNRFQWDDNLNRFKNLRILKLINCGIPALSHSIKLRSLEELDLRHNNIEHISSSIFADLPKLKSLDLSRNRIRVLPTGVFTFLRQMETLSLAYNDISELPASLLYGQTGFKALHLDGNKISSNNLNEFFREQQLERLELNNCDLPSIWDLSLEKLTKLKRLGLGGNGLGEVPTMALRGLQQLEALDLSNNDIREIPVDPFWSSNITQLFLSHNRLGGTLRTLNLEAYGPIRELDLSHNAFEHFSSELLGETQKTIEILNLSGNKLGFLDDHLIRNLTALKILHLSDTGIAEIPAYPTPEYSQLTLLNLSNNALDDLPSRSRHIFGSLHQLDISMNRFETLSSQVMETFINRLDQVYLHGNPWDCGCSVDLLKSHMKERRRYRLKLKYEETKCATPEALEGAVIYNLNYITDCAVLFGARYGFTQATELGVLLALLLAVSLFASLIILFAYYRRERRQKISYMDAHRSHSRTALTLSQHISPSPSSVNEPLTPPTDNLQVLSPKIPPPPPPIRSSY